MRLPSHEKKRTRRRALSPVGNSARSICYALGHVSAAATPPPLRRRRRHSARTLPSPSPLSHASAAITHRCCSDVELVCHGRHGIHGRQEGTLGLVRGRLREDTGSLPPTPPAPRGPPSGAPGPPPSNSGRKSGNSCAGCSRRN